MEQKPNPNNPNTDNLSVAPPETMSKYSDAFEAHEVSDLEESFSKRIYSTLWMAYHPFRYRLFLSLTLGFIGRLLLLSNANLIGLWVDKARAPESWVHQFSTQQFIAILLGTAIVGFLMTMVFRVLFSRLSANAISQLYDEVTARTSRYPLSFFDRNPVGRILTRFSSDYGNIFRLFGGPLAEFVAIIFDLIIMTVLIGVASPYFLIFVALTGVLNYFTYRWRIPGLRVARRALSASRSPSIAHFSETAQGSTTIRSYGKENIFIERFLGLDKFYIGNKLVTVKRILSFSFLMNALSAVFLLMTGLMGLWLINSGRMTIGAVGVAFSFIALSGNTVQMFFEWLSQIEEALVGVERLDRLLQLPLEKYGKLPAWTKFPTDHSLYTLPEEKKITAQSLIPSNQASIEYRNIHFRYGEKLPFIFKDFNLQIGAKEKIGIIGSTGSGKSTLTQILLGLYPLAQGEIFLGGKPLSDLDLEYFRRHFSVISQDPLLFRTTLRDNLDMDRIATDDEIWQALALVQLDEWVRSKPEQLNFAIEEKGANLSAGEKQLLSLSRCLLQKRPILILDEATSHVDPGSEEMMMKASREFFNDRTQIIIAHRLSTLEQCDRVLWLEKGRIHSLGPSAQVLKEMSTSLNDQMNCGTDKLLT